jgi:predicted nucleic acid-binding protein
MKVIVLDSTPLGLVTQPLKVPVPDACRQWMRAKIAQGIQVVVPEIIDYEIRRELLRAGKSASIEKLDEFIAHPAITYLPLTTTAMKLAAELWAKARQQGKPTADPHALDVDVILSAQVIAAKFPPAEFIVATANVRHLTQFIPADLWENI